VGLAIISRAGCPLNRCWSRWGGWGGRVGVLLLLLLVVVCGPVRLRFLLQIGGDRLDLLITICHIKKPETTFLSSSLFVGLFVWHERGF
jgi:hypothetical protein